MYNSSGVRTMKTLAVNLLRKYQQAQRLMMSQKSLVQKRNQHQQQLRKGQLHDRQLLQLRQEAPQLRFLQKDVNLLRARLMKRFCTHMKIQPNITNVHRIQVVIGLLSLDNVQSRCTLVSNNKFVFGKYQHTLSSIL